MSIQISTFFFGLVIFIGIVSAFSLAYNDLADKFGIEHSDLTKSFDDTSLSIASKEKELKGTLKTDTSGLTNIFDLSFFTATQFAGIILNFPEIITNFMNTVLRIVGTNYQIPYWFIGMVGLLISFAIFFAILSGLLKRDV